MRSKATHLKFLETEEGHRVDTLEDMREVVQDYFKRVFTEPGNQVPDITIESPRVVTQEQRSKLTAGGLS